MDEENPVNPDPEYPRNLGFYFRGYQLDGEGTPTFSYEASGVRITDHCEPVEGGEQPLLRRSLTFDSPSARTLWVRVAEGELQEVAPRTFERQGLRIVLPDLPHQLRSFKTSASTPEESKTLSELLLRLDLPAGRTTATTIDHVLLP